MITASSRRVTPLVAASLACAMGVIGAGAGLDDLAALQRRLDRLEVVARQVEAVVAVKRLQHAYGHYAELGLWNDFADLFAESAVGHYPAGALNKEAIRKLFFEEVGRGRLGLEDGRLYPHIVMQPVVTVAPDGKSAKGRWHVMAMLGAYGGNASWAGGVYENAYALENGTWKINELRYYGQYNGRYEDAGWTATKGETPFHFDPRRAGVPVENPAPSQTTAAPAALPGLSSRYGDLAVRVRRMSDEIDVTNLQNAYGYYVDRKMWDDVADLFAPTGSMELGPQGVYVGKASIRRGLNQFGPQGLQAGQLNDHLQLQVVVDVLPDGRTARARGVDLGMTGTNGKGAEWSESIFENEFVKQDGVWKIQSLHLYPRLIVDADKGWGKDARPAPGPSAEFPPDRPSSVPYDVYPKFQMVPFHFLNPATGRPTQYPEGTRVPAELARVAPAPAPSARTRADLDSAIADVERTLERVKGYHASENLASAYGYYVDEFAWDETADIFSRDGFKELSYVGAYVGRERIRRSLKLRYPNGKPTTFLTVHQTTQPVIHVSADGRSANVRVRLFQMGGPSGGAGSWIGGIYENKTVNEDGVWKLSAMDLDYVWTAAARGGWAHVAERAPAPPPAIVKEFPPDRPLRGPVAPPFPIILDVPFHYRNPVSGRLPALLLP